MNKEEIKRLNKENELLKHKISALEELNIDLQCRVKCAEEGRYLNERTIDFQRQTLGKYEKMFNYLTGGDSNE